MAQMKMFVRVEGSESMGKEGCVFELAGLVSLVDWRHCPSWYMLSLQVWINLGRCLWTIFFGEAWEGGEEALIDGVDEG